ncbi:MAG: ABC transporter ATP-binding protein [Streptosporangiaceae bacterium]
MTELTAQGLHKAFGAHPANPVLAGLDLTVPAGSLTAILGPSGSGKTTLLRVLAGFEQADAGTVQIGRWVVDGPGKHVPPEKRRIGYVPQEGSLFPHLTVAANVGFGLPSKARRGPRIGELLEAVGLAGLGQRYPHQLSGGQQQRVALARALAIEPALVLLDEPFAALDAHMRASIRADVQSIFRSAGTTAVLVTHDQDEALSMADRVAVLRGGRIAQCAAPQDLYIRPADPQLAGFIGDANLLDGQLTGAGVRTIFGDLQLADGADLEPGQVTVLVRPEQLEVRERAAANGNGAGGSGAAESGESGVAGRVVACEYYGHDAVLRVQPGAAAGIHGIHGIHGVPEIIVRIAGGPSLPLGADVLVNARGPVLAWPRG